MTEERRLHVSPVVATIAVLSTLLAGAGGMYFLMRDGRIPDGARAAAPTAEAVSQPVSPTVDRGATTLPDVVVPLTKQAAERAGIELTEATTQSVSDTLRLPGIVEPNAYRQVSVTPLVAGRV